MKDLDGKLMSFPRVKTVHVFDLRAGWTADTVVRVPDEATMAVFLVSESDVDAMTRIFQTNLTPREMPRVTICVWRELERETTTDGTSEQQALDLARRLSGKDDPAAAERVLAGMLARMPEEDLLTEELQAQKGDEGHDDKTTTPEA